MAKVGAVCENNIFFPVGSVQKILQSTDGTARGFLHDGGNCLHKICFPSPIRIGLLYVYCIYHVQGKKELKSSRDKNGRHEP